MWFAFWWKMLLSMGADQALTPQCGYITSGRVYLKMGGFIYCKRSSYWLQLYRACTCTQKHTQLAGSFTTQAAEYPYQTCLKVVDVVTVHMPQVPGPWLPADERFTDCSRPSAVRTATSLSSTPYAVPSLFTFVLSECLPLVGTMKHRFKSKGHINVQEAYAFRSIYVGDLPHAVGLLRCRTLWSTYQLKPRGDRAAPHQTELFFKPGPKFYFVDISPEGYIHQLGR